MKPLFSCVMPVKGPRPYMEEALASLAAQGMGDDLEVIVQDADVEPDTGQSDAFNKGFAKAHGEWLFWLNADDVLLPGALECVMRRVKVEEQKAREGVRALEWVAGNMMVIDERGRVLKCFRDKGRKRDYDGKPVRVYGPSSFFRRELLARVGGFDVSLRYCMDTDLWCRFRDAGAWFAKVDRYIFGFRCHPGSTTMGVKPPGEQSRQDAEVVAMHARRGVFLSAWDTHMAHFKRLVDGSYVRGFLDTLRYRGKNFKACFGDVT